MSKDEIDSEKFWQKQNDLWRKDRVAGGGGAIARDGFVKKAWIPEVAVLPMALAKKNPHFNPNGVCMPKGVDINSSLGRAILEGQQMAYETNNMSGSLFKNDKKVEGSNQPDYRGTIKINDVEYWQSAWIKQSASGVTFMSFAYQLKDEQPAAAPAAAPKIDDSVPF